jgi:hypothetical protein
MTFAFFLRILEPTGSHLPLKWGQISVKGDAMLEFDGFNP